MPIDMQDDFRLNVPVGSILCVKVVTNSTHINATGNVNHPTQEPTGLSHGSIMGRTKRVTLGEVGTHIARVNLIFNAAKDETATVEYSIESSGTPVAPFNPTFQGKSVGKDKFIARAKWTLSVI
jgi:hypothetical protein